MFRTDLAWAAGFFDGEGTFFRAGPTPGAALYQVSLENLDVFANTVGVGRVGGPYDKTTAAIKRKPQWTYWAYGDNAREVIRAISPWLGSVKRAQALRALGMSPESSLAFGERTIAAQPQKSLARSPQ